MSERRSYNLLDQQWIPVVWESDGTHDSEPKVGIRDALLRAHEIKCISHTAPFIEFGLYRLLITIVLDAYIVAGKRPTIGKMKAMLDDGKFDVGVDVIAKYLDEHKDRFDLWSDDQPFLQMASTTGNGGAVSKMIAPVPSGTKTTFWHHFTQVETRLTESEAAQELCAVAPFCFDYAPKDICTIGGDPPIYVVVHGHSLFETIVYNLPRPSGRLTMRQETDGGPAWRCKIEDAASVPRTPTYLQAWTWPVRQIRLMYDGDSLAITESVNVAGAEKTAARDRVRGWRDPNAGTIVNSQGIRHMRATDLIPPYARASGQGDQNPMDFWRDLIPMCLVGSEGEALRSERVRSRPEVVTNALRIAEGKLLRLAVYGFVDKGGKNNKVFRTWFRSALWLPTEVARDSRLSANAIDAFKTVQKVADALQTAVRMLRPPVKASKNKRPTAGRNESDVIADFWQRLEPLVSRTYLTDLAESKLEPDRRLWTEVRRHAQDVFRRATNPHRRTADGLFRIANATNWFERRMAKLLPKPKSETFP